jgi:hypothetical protein
MTPKLSAIAAGRPHFPNANVMMIPHPRARTKAKPSDCGNDMAASKMRLYRQHA